MIPQGLLPVWPENLIRIGTRWQGLSKRIYSVVGHTGYRLAKGNTKRRFNKSKRLLNMLKHPKEPEMVWFFSEEKNFCQDQKFHRRNNRWIAMRPKDVPKITKTKLPATVMVFGVILSKGDAMPPHIFETRIRINTDIYLSVMEDVVLPWIKETTGNRPWVWQQDNASCHVSMRRTGSKRTATTSSPTIPGHPAIQI